MEGSAGGKLEAFHLYRKTLWPPPLGQPLGLGEGFEYQLTWRIKGSVNHQL
jgi:hypothetical protein